MVRGVVCTFVLNFLSEFSDSRGRGSRSICGGQDCSGGDLPGWEIPGDVVFVVAAVLCGVQENPRWTSGPEQREVRTTWGMGSHSPSAEAGGENRYRARRGHGLRAGRHNAPTGHELRPASARAASAPAPMC